MNTISTLIIDDEQDCRETLRMFLTKYCPEITSISEAASVHEALQQIAQQKFQLVFLDINMPGDNGFALFEKIPEPDFHLVFVTAYDEYALKAIKHNALDYILKPVNIKELIAVVQKYLKRTENSNTAPDMNVLLEIISRSTKNNKIALPASDGFIYVKAEDIIRCEANGNYTMFYFVNRPKMLISQTLGTYEELLQTHGFIRIHHHHLININHVEKYQRGRGGVVLMSDNKLIDVSQRKKNDFLRCMEGLSGNTSDH